MPVQERLELGLIQINERLTLCFDRCAGQILYTGLMKAREKGVDTLQINVSDPSTGFSRLVGGLLDTFGERLPRLYGALPPLSGAYLNAAMPHLQAYQDLSQRVRAHGFLMGAARHDPEAQLLAIGVAPAAKF